MVQYPNCIIILVPIPSLPKLPLLTALISCKLTCRFSPLRNTGYPMRKLTIHFGNRPPHKTPRETASHAAQYYSAAIQNATFKANHIHRNVICSSHSQILPLPPFYIPQNVNLHNKTTALKKSYKLLYSVAHLLYKTNTETPNLTTLRRSYLKYCKLKDKNTRR